MKRVLLIGLGRWGGNHLRVLRALPVELFVADTDLKRLATAHQAGLPETHAGSNYRDFLTAVDCAVVVTPAQTHYPICRELLEAGRDVFVEKPMTLVSSEALELVQMAKSRGQLLQVGHILRFEPALQWLRGAIQEGRLGRVQILRAQFAEFKRPRTDSGMMLADAIHFVDLFNYLLGGPPRRATAVVQDFLGRGMEDSALLSLEYERDSGVTWGTIEANCFLPEKTRSIITIGSELTVECNLTAARHKIRTFANRHLKGETGWTAAKGTVQTVETPNEEPLLSELRAFLDSVETRRRPSADGWAGFEAVRVVEAALKSAGTGETVKL